MIEGMQAPLLRARQLARSALHRVRATLRPERVSQRNLRRFLRDVRRRSPIEMPRTAPESLAIVASCYRHREYLPAMLRSIASQTRRPDEVVLVDDGSEDDSDAVIRSWMGEQPWLAGGRGKLILHQENAGQAASLNEGIAGVRSELVMILNSDDYLLHDAIAVALREFEKHPELALIGGHSIHFSGDAFLDDAAKLTRDYSPEPLALTIRTPDAVSGYRGYNDLNMTHSGSCFRRQAWEAVGGYRPRRERCVPFSDRDLQIRINALFPVGVALDTPLSFWRTDSSTDHGRDS
jgi:glycosyltransferase involved in cell wall biosynthesis